MTYIIIDTFNKSSGKRNMKKAWQGRFTEKTSGIVESFTESISFDRRLWKYDIEGSIAHAQMLARQGIITHNEAKKITGGLRQIAREIESGKFSFREDLEDIHMNIEAALIQEIGDVGRKLHTARSRNDQVALDLRLYLRAESGEITALIQKLQGIFLDLAGQYFGDSISVYICRDILTSRGRSRSSSPTIFLHMLKCSRETGKDSAIP